MSTMDRKTALEVLKAYRIGDYLNYEDEDLNQAIDVAIHELERICQEPPEKEYYGG